MFAAFLKFSFMTQRDGAQLCPWSIFNTLALHFSAHFYQVPGLPLHLVLNLE